METEQKPNPRAFETLDCRICANYRESEWRLGRCAAILRCVDGSSYKATAPIQLWEESPKQDPGF